MNELKKIAARHASSVTVGVMLVQQGLQFVQNGEYEIGAALIIAGGVLIFVDIYAAFKGIAVWTLKKLGEVR